MQNSLRDAPLPEWREEGTNPKLFQNVTEIPMEVKGFWSVVQLGYLVLSMHPVLPLHLLHNSVPNLFSKKNHWTTSRTVKLSLVFGIWYFVRLTITNMHVFQSRNSSVSQDYFILVVILFCYIIDVVNKMGVLLVHIWREWHNNRKQWLIKSRAITWTRRDMKVEQVSTTCDPRGQQQLANHIRLHVY